MKTLYSILAGLFIGWGTLSGVVCLRDGDIVPGLLGFAGALTALLWLAEAFDK